MRLGILALMVCGLLSGEDVALRGGNVLACETYSFREPLLAGKLDVFAIPELFKKHGIKGISFNERYFTSRDEAYIDRLKTATKDAGRTIVALQADGNLALADEAKRRLQIEHYKESLRLANRLGAPVMRINAGAVSSGENEAVGVRRLIEGLNEMLPLARQLKVRIAIENHGGVSSTADNLINIIRGTDSKWVGVLLDLGNFPPEIRYDEIQKLAPYTFGTHVKVMKMNERGDIEDYDIARVFKILKAQKYKGSLSIEYSGRNDPMEGVPNSRDLIRKYW
ncbi:MAG TPA: sugar phosphate isomerase/epimerase family protein [Bryobacteraceae bacterium]|nr:sugar phosphate isomerase/epimerase family protein [Bryobacteraceae bacterium]